MTNAWFLARTPGSTSGTRLPILLGLLFVAGLVLAACTSKHDDDLSETIADNPTEQSDDATNNPSTPGAGDPLLDFFQCLRDGGLDVADPEPGDRVSLQGVDPNDPAQVATVDNCRNTHLAEFDGQMTVGQGNMGDNMSSPEALIAFVDCMRESGIDMPDPDSDGRLYLPEDFDPNDREFQAAAQQCAQHLDGGIMMGQPGAGGGMVQR
jgi:hypothetical protein